MKQFRVSSFKFQVSSLVFELETWNLKPGTRFMFASFRRLLSLDDPPERTALAFSIGVFIAFSPFLGLHTVLATFVAFAFRFNKVAVYSGTFINNPFLTLVPIIIASHVLIFVRLKSRRDSPVA